jgi:hypothetical protein
MKLDVNERRPRSRWRDLIFAHAPTKDRELRPVRVTSGGTTPECFYRERLAQLRWEDDGGRTGHDAAPAAG